MLPVTFAHPRLSNTGMTITSRVSCVLLMVLVLAITHPAVSFGQVPSAPPPPTVRWADTGLSTAMDAIGVTVQHVTEVLLRDGGSQVWAAFYDVENRSYLARSFDGGATWYTSVVPGLKQVRALLPLDDGSVLFGGSPNTGRAPLVRLLPIAAGAKDLRWAPCATGAGSVVLPTAHAGDVWDLVLDATGTVYIGAGGSSSPAVLKHLVFRSDDRCRTLVAAAPLPTGAVGVTALALDAYGRLFAASAETADHDDPDTAGTARVAHSDDGGRTWRHSAELVGANRAYRLLVKSDGQMLAGTGLSGHFYRSSDRGTTWGLTPHVPDGLKPFGFPPVLTASPATRVYSILELEGGWILVGTGNDTGDLYISPDNGSSWFPTGDTGVNLVSWASALSPDGTIWIGTGSRGGTVWTGRLIVR